jgi:hypothetical protein
MVTFDAVALLAAQRSDGSAARRVTLTWWVLVQPDGALAGPETSTEIPHLQTKFGPNL